MTRTARGNRRRRLAYLATSSFVASSLLTGGTVLTAVMTPTVALAAEASVDRGPPTFTPHRLWVASVEIEARVVSVSGDTSGTISPPPYEPARYTVGTGGALIPRAPR